MDFSNLVALDYETTLQSIVLVPLILTVAGILIWVIGWRREADDGPTWIKWVGLAPLLAAALVSKDTFFLMVGSGLDGEMFRDSIDNSRRLMYSGYFAFGAPVLCIVGFVAWFFIHRVMGKYR